MTRRDRDTEDLLHDALHAAADSLEPSGDGLRRIRARLTPPRAAPVAWIMAACTTVAWRVLGALDSLGAWLAGLHGPAWWGRWVAPPPRRHPWRVRLAAAAVAAAFAVALGFSAVAPPVRLAISQTGSLLRFVGSRLSGGTGGLWVSSHGTMPFPGSDAAATATTAPQHRAPPSVAQCPPPAGSSRAASANPGAAATSTSCGAPAASPVPASRHSAAPSPTAPATSTPPASPTPSATPTPTPTPTPSATPTPTPTTTPSATPSLSASSGPS